MTITNCISLYDDTFCKVSGWCLFPYFVSVEESEVCWWAYVITWGWRWKMKCENGVTCGSLTACKKSILLSLRSSFSQHLRGIDSHLHYVWTLLCVPSADEISVIFTIVWSYTVCEEDWITELNEPLKPASAWLAEPNGWCPISLVSLCSVWNWLYDCQPDVF